MLGYCQAKIGGKQYGREWTGGHRCTRRATTWVGDKDDGKALCTQHAKRAKRAEYVRV